jgi:O-acetyl-ADP-ribose deacetylase (regulator of RNase III)
MRIIEGDLLQIPAGVILHQVNCVGVTGGLAGALRRKYPLSFEDYLIACNQLTQPPFILSRVNQALAIGHVFGQPAPGPHTSLVMVDKALTRARLMIHESTDVFAPHLMGCGLGGGNWNDYLPLLTKHFPHITIVRLPQTT